MTRLHRRSTALAAACSLGLLIAGCGSAHPAARTRARAGTITINTRTGSAQSVALTGTVTGVDTTGTTSTTTGTATGTTTTGTTTTGTGTIADATGIGVTSGGVQSLSRPFAPDSPWNTTVTRAPIAANSASLIKQATERYGVTAGNSSENLTTGLIGGSGSTGGTRTLKQTLYINTTIWTDPIVIANGGHQVQVVCRQINLPPPDNACGDGYRVSSLSIPVTGFPKPSYDGWLTVIDENAGYAYDLWRARLGGGVLSYQFLRRWDLNGPGFLPPSYASARGSGLPLFAGEILPRDIMSGHVDHALAISVPGPASRFYVQPASATDGNGAFTSLPEGARLRLKSSFDTAAALRHLPGGVSTSSARALLTALRTYGAIVVDRSAVPTVYAVPNFNWNQPLRNAKGALLSPNGRTALPPAYQAKRYATPLLSPNALGFLKLNDFNVISLPQIYEYPPLSSAPQAGGVDGVAPQQQGYGGTTATSLNTTGGAASTGVGTAVP